MSLAQVVYKISNDNRFAEEWHKDPKSALDGNGYRLTQEEIAFLSTGLRQASNGNKVKFIDLEPPTTFSWRE